VLTVLKAGGLATVQDLGWSTGRARGLPRGGAVDPPELQLANALVGNFGEAAAIELALGVLSVRFHSARRFATAGAVAVASLEGAEIEPRTTAIAAAGALLTVAVGPAGRFGYLAVEGGIDVPVTLGSRSTYLPIGMGGFQGRRLGPPDQLPLGPPSTKGPPPGFRPSWPASPTGPIRLVAGPQAHLFSPDSLARLESEGYTVAAASDRMGTRLAGPPIVPLVPASLPSEAACLGAMQVPDAGQPIVLSVDGPTVGGYPKVAVVATVDFPRFGQLPPGAGVRFQLISLAEAQSLRTATAERLEEDLEAVRAARD
jgi:biotin-dependent carboxylase-like uncharacterized protein